MDTKRYSGAKLRSVLAAQGRRQDWLADQIGIHESYVTKILKEDRPLSRSHALKAATALGIPVHWLEDDPVPVGAERDA